MPPPRSRGVIVLVPDRCTSCMICARECPDWCIHIDSHLDVEPPRNPRGRPRSVAVLDRFAIDFGSCLYCGICIDVCPFDALHWSPDYSYPANGLTDLVHEADRLAAAELSTSELSTSELSTAELSTAEPAGNTGSQSGR